MTTTEAFDTWWTESPENFCKAPLGSPECEMHRRTWNAATERAAKRVSDVASMYESVLRTDGKFVAAELRHCAAAIRARDEGVTG